MTSFASVAVVQCTMALAMGVDDFCFLSSIELLHDLHGSLDAYSFSDYVTSRKYPTRKRCLEPRGSQQAVIIGISRP